MSAALDMSLDDIINKTKSGSGNFRARARARASPAGPVAGPARRFSNRAASLAAPYVTAKAPEMTWQHDLFADQHVAYPGRASSSIETGAKLYISNLDYGVSNDDIKELFSEVGDLKRHGIHYDRSGRSKGTAEVVFLRRADAVAAVKRYNNVQLDGKLMKIEIVGTNISTPPMKIEIVGTNISTPSVVPAANGVIGNSNGVPRRLLSSGQRRGGEFRKPGGRGQGIRRGRGHGRGRGEKISAEELDTDLEKYHAEAMELN